MFKAPLRETCAQCQDVVYPTEKMVLEGMVIHKNCFICKHCKRKLTVTNFAAVNGQIFCKTHYLALFKEHGGRYDKAFGAFQSGRNLGTHHDDAANKSTISATTDADLDKSTISAITADSLNKSALDTTIASEQLETSRLSTTSEVDAANSVKARREAFEKKSSSSQILGQPKPAPAAVKEERTVTSPVKSIASALEKKPSEPSVPAAPALAGMTSPSGSVKSLTANLDKMNIVSKLGQAYAPKPVSSSSAPVASETQAPAVQLPGMVFGAAAKAEGLQEEEGLSHATIARPIIPAKRRRPTVDKGLFTSPSQPHRKLLELDENGSQLGLGKTEAEEEIEEVPAHADLSAAFTPNSDIAALKATLASAGGLFERLEAKKRALQMLVQQKKQTIKKLKEVRQQQPSASENPNEGENEEEEDVEQNPETVVVEDEDAFLAIQSEQDGNIEQAKVHHFKAFANAFMAQQEAKVLSESNARTIAAFASFAVRHLMSELQEDDDLVQQVSDAFEVLSASTDQSIVAIKESAEAEHAAFLFEVLHFTDEALASFQKAHELYPDDAEMLCNYARFVKKVLAREAMEDGENKQVKELLELAADLYREALDIIPDVPDVRANLAAILVQLSKMSDGDKEEEKRLLNEAKYNLEKAVETRNPIVLYNLACVECLLGDSSACEAHLKAAVEANPGFRDDMQQDPDLELVANAQWFKALVGA